MSKRIETVNLPLKQKIEIVRRRKLRNLTRRELKEKYGVTAETIDAWVIKFDKGMIFDLMNHDDLQDKIDSICKSSSNISDAWVIALSMNYGKSFMSFKKSVDKTGIFKKERMSDADYKIAREKATEILLNNDFFTLFDVHVRSGLHYSLVTSLAIELGVSKKNKKGRKRGEQSDAERVNVGIKKPVGLNPMMAMFLGVKL